MMIWLAKRVFVFCVLVSFGLFAAAALTAFKAPPLLIVLTPFLIPLVLTWPIANRWEGNKSILPAQASRVRSPGLTLLLTAVAFVGLALSIGLWSFSVPIAIGVFLGAGVAIERVLRTSRPVEGR